MFKFMFFKGVFFNFSVMVFSDETPIGHYSRQNIVHMHKSVPSVESINLLTIIEAKMAQNGEGLNEQLFTKLSVLSGL